MNFTILVQRSQYQRLRKALLLSYSINSDGLQPRSDGLQPTTDGLQPTSDGLQPKSDGLQPKSDGLQPRTVPLTIFMFDSAAAALISNCVSRHVLLEELIIRNFLLRKFFLFLLLLRWAWKNQEGFWISDGVGLWLQQKYRNKARTLKMPISRRLRHRTGSMCDKSVLAIMRMFDHLSFSYPRPLLVRSVKTDRKLYSLPSPVNVELQPAALFSGSWRSIPICSPRARPASPVRGFAWRSRARVPFAHVGHEFLSLQVWMPPLFWGHKTSWCTKTWTGLPHTSRGPRSAPHGPSTMWGTGGYDYSTNKKCEKKRANHHSKDQNEAQVKSEKWTIGRMHSVKIHFIKWFFKPNEFADFLVLVSSSMKRRFIWNIRISEKTEAYSLHTGKGSRTFRGYGCSGRAEYSARSLIATAEFGIAGRAAIPPTRVRWKPKRTRDEEQVFL